MKPTSDAMKLTRRQLLRLGATIGIGSLFLGRKTTSAQSSPALSPFVDPLRIPSVAPGQSVVTIRMLPIQQKLHRDLPPTPLWGYNGEYVGPTFEARSGQQRSVRWVNELPSAHLFPIDHTLHGAESDLPDVRTVVHLHGAKVLPDSDGHPEAWFTRDFATTGPTFSRRTFQYPNDQPATALWYHDHTLGITRLNVFAGLAGFYLIRDATEDALAIPKGTFEVPLLFQDRIFNADGSLNYPVQDPGVSPPIPPVWIPEFFGDAALVNGTVWPYLDVEPRRYRFRMLNGCNARFLHLTLVGTATAAEPLSFYQIGADQGFLPEPVQLPDLFIAPSERFDVVIDFTGQLGKAFVLKNDALAPYPGGGAVELPQLMQFRVTKPLSDPPDPPLPSALAPFELLRPEDAVRTRRLLLAEVDDPSTGDPIVALLGTAEAGGLHWDAPVTEGPRANSIEVWELLNTTTDAHPIHVHLVRFQVLNRQKFDLNVFLATGQLNFLGPPEAPAANERPAWKDVVTVFPGDPDEGVGSLTRIIQKFELPRRPTARPGHALPYVWHCHILEHEDNDMMRPFNVLT